MRTYEVEVTKQLATYVTIQAEDAQTAREKAEDWVCSCEHKDLEWDCLAIDATNCEPIRATKKKK